MKRACLAAMMVMAIAHPALATEFVVDSSCAFNGSGIAKSRVAAGVDQCASNDGAPGAFNSASGIQSAMNATSAGDTVYIRTGRGTYVTSSRTGYSNGAGFNLPHSGADGRPIVISGYPGDAPPVLAGCPDGASTWSACNRNVIGAQFQSYYRITGLRIRGMLMIDGNNPGGSPGIEIDHNELTQGYSPNDGNWVTMFVSFGAAPWIHHNYFHDIRTPSDYTANSGQPSGAIDMFSTTNAIVEYNTIIENDLGQNYVYCLHDKISTGRNVWRYNYCDQTNATNGWLGPNAQTFSNQGDLVYNNVFVGRGSALYCLRSGDSNPVNMSYFNNTCTGWNVGFYGEIGTTGYSIYNNLFLVKQYNIQSFGSITWNVRDYNFYTNGRSWQLNGTTYSNVSSLKSGSGRDAASQAVDNMGFIDNSTDFRLTSNSAAKNACRVGGVSGGGVIDCGAYSGGIACIGSSCDGSGPAPAPPPPPVTQNGPQAPSNLRVIQ